MNKNQSKELSAFWKKTIILFFSDLAFRFLRDVWSLHTISWEFGPGFFFSGPGQSPPVSPSNETKRNDTGKVEFDGRLLQEYIIS